MNSRVQVFLFTRVLAGALALAPLVLAQVPKPQIDGVVNAANFRPPASPGALISIFGNNLAPGVESAQAPPLKTTLMGTIVYIDGMASPLTYVSPAQINAQVPYNIPPNSSASIQVQVSTAMGSNLSSNSALTVVPLAPAIFTQSTETGVGLGAILNQDNSVNTDANPAHPGDIVQIFATGMGATSPAVATGAPGKGEPLAQTPNVTIGGQNAMVKFAGAAPGFAGLDQVNAVVPNVSTGDQAILISFPGAQTAMNVTIAISSR